MLASTVCRAIGVLCHLGTSIYYWPSRPIRKLLTLQELSPEAEIVNVRFTKSVIASKEAFTYEAAQNRKDDKSVIMLTSSESLLTLIDP